MPAAERAVFAADSPSIAAVSASQLGAWHGSSNAAVPSPAPGGAKGVSRGLRVGARGDKTQIGRTLLKSGAYGVTKRLD